MANWNHQTGSEDVRPASQPDTESECPPAEEDVHGPKRVAYQRHLPHQVPPGFPIFLTWNLKGSLPERAILALEQKRRRLNREPTRMDESNKDRNIRQAKIVFARRDRFLDEEAERNCVRLESRTYPMWLSGSACCINRRSVDSVGCSGSLRPARVCRDE